MSPGVRERGPCGAKLSQLAATSPTGKISGFTVLGVWPQRGHGGSEKWQATIRAVNDVFRMSHSLVFSALRALSCNSAPQWNLRMLLTHATSRCCRTAALNTKLTRSSYTHWRTQPHSVPASLCQAPLWPSRQLTTRATAREEERTASAAGPPPGLANTPWTGSERDQQVTNAT